jgi:MFS family permease
MRRWKLSETDLLSRSKWIDYSRAKDEMFVHTDIPEAPWFVVEADDIAGIVERRLHDDDPGTPRRLVGIANAGVAVAVLLLAVAPWGVAAAALVVSGALREASFPLVQAWVNRGADPATRATLNSLVGQSESVGEIGGGPLLGGIGGAFGVPAALVTSSAVFGAGALLTRWRPEPATASRQEAELLPGRLP